jgi:hypothetical protein
MNRCLFTRRTFASSLLPAGLIALSTSLHVGPARAAEPLAVNPASVITAMSGDVYFVLMDLFPHAAVLDPLAVDAWRARVRATADRLAAVHARDEEASDARELAVMVVYVTSLDEYLKQNFAGMRRFGEVRYQFAADRTPVFRSDSLNKDAR